jgi:hypothetical protein
MIGRLTIPLAAALALACSGPTEPRQPMDGVWVLDSSTAGLPPRQMTLTQTGMTISGTGTAMGVDRPIAITISGTYGASPVDGPPVVSLQFLIDDAGGVTGSFTGTLSGDGRLQGTIAYSGNTFSPGTLWFVRPLATGLEGTVTRGPITPVCVVGVPCDAPFFAGFEVLAQQRLVARFVSDSAGHYEVLLAPGAYAVVPDSGAPIFPQGQARQVTVGPVGMTHVDLQFDTGIR